MSILPNQYKKSFKVVLDSNSIGGNLAYSGIQFNANYPVNLLSQVDPADIDTHHVEPRAVPGGSH